jgi:hypothetical protein
MYRKSVVFLYHYYVNFLDWNLFFFLVEISERKLLEWPISWTHFEFFRVGANQKSPLKTTDLQKVAYKLYHIILYQVHLAMSGIQTHDFIFEALILWYEISAIRFVSMGTIFTRFIDFWWGKCVDLLTFEGENDIHWDQIFFLQKSINPHIYRIKRQ